MDRRSPDGGGGEVRPEQTELQAKTCIAAAIYEASAAWPEILTEALGLPESAWPSPMLHALASWALFTKRKGFVPTEAKLGSDRPDLYGEAQSFLDSHRAPLSTAEMEARPFVAGYRGRQAAEQLENILKRLRDSPEKAGKVLEAGIPALQGLAATFRNGPRLTILRPSEIMAIPHDPTDNLLGARLLTRRGQMVIAGAGGVGKSRLALQLATCSVLGRRFLDLPTYSPSLRWLVLQAENDPHRQRADLEAMQRLAGDEWAAVDSRLFLHALVTEADGFLNLDDAGAVSGIRQALDLFRPDVVVVDSLYNVGIGDLNKDVDMRETLTALGSVMRHRNPNRAIVVLHHATTGKGGIQKLVGQERASFGRNSKVLHSWARGFINVAPLSPDNNDLLAVVCGKASNGAEFQPFAVRLDRESMTYQLAPDVDVREKVETVVSGKPDVAVTPEDVEDICDGLTKKELVARIIKDFGVVQSRAYKVIGQAEESGIIRMNPHTKRFKGLVMPP
jgi:AAA domain